MVCRGSFSFPGSIPLPAPIIGQLLRSPPLDGGCPALGPFVARDKKKPAKNSRATTKTTPAVVPTSTHAWSSGLGGLDWCARLACSAAVRGSCDPDVCVM